MHEVLPVLLVEDDEPLREAVRLVLEQAGHQVLTAATATEAMNVIRSMPLCAVLSDVHLSVGTGFDVADCADRVAPGLPVALMSALPREDLGWPERNSSVKLFLNKPAAPSQIMTALECLVRGRG